MIVKKSFVLAIALTCLAGVANAQTLVERKGYTQPKFLSRGKTSTVKAVTSRPAVMPTVMETRLVVKGDSELLKRTSSADLSKMNLIRKTSEGEQVVATFDSLRTSTVTVGDSVVVFDKDDEKVRIFEFGDASAGGAAIKIRVVNGITGEEITSSPGGFGGGGEVNPAGTIGPMN